MPFQDVTFSFLLPSPKASDDNLMQEVNQNLAEEVRIVAFQNNCFDDALSHDDRITSCSLFRLV